MRNRGGRPFSQETARPLAELKGLDIETRDELVEIDFGDWTGKRIHEIKDDERWTRFNAFRAGTAVQVIVPAAALDAFTDAFGLLRGRSS